MAVCLLDNDILRSNFCGYSLKQITDIYLANYEQVTGTTVQDNEVATITMAGDAKFYHIEPAKDTATYEDSLQIGDGGSKYRQASISFNIGGAYNKDMVDVLDALSLGRYIAVAKFSDGTYVAFGRVVPMEASTASLSAAAEATGFSGVQVTLEASTTEAPLPLTEAAIKTVLGQE